MNDELAGLWGNKEVEWSAKGLGGKAGAIVTLWRK